MTRYTPTLPNRSRKNKPIRYVRRDRSDESSQQHWRVEIPPPRLPSRQTTWPNLRDLQKQSTFQSPPGRSEGQKGPPLAYGSAMVSPWLNRQSNCRPKNHDGRAKLSLDRFFMRGLLCRPRYPALPPSRPRYPALPPSRPRYPAPRGNALSDAPRPPHWAPDAVVGGCPAAYATAAHDHALASVATKTKARR